MKTKPQKAQELASQLERLGSSHTVLFTEFNGTSAEDINRLRRLLKDLDSEFKVSRKRLLRIAFNEKQININPEDFNSQLGVIFSPKELIDIAGPLFKFAKDVENFKVLSGYDLESGEVLEESFIVRISSLPSREVLLGQLVGMVSAPLKMFMSVLNERAKKI